MKRYYDNTTDSEFNPYDDGDEEEQVGIDKEKLIEAIHLNLAEVQARQELLDRAILLAKDTWFWRFRSRSYQNAAIRQIFLELLELMSEE